MFEFVLIQPGTFMMGSPKNEKNRFSDETLHEVKISKPFYMQTTPVTQEQWQAVMKVNPSFFTGQKNLPVECVSWYDANYFIEQLNKQTKDTYRLPTEAEWEYVCRAKNQSAFSFGQDENQIDKYAWCKNNAGGKTYPVAHKAPNDWGLYDMHGNVCEWVADRYRSSYIKEDVVDPKGAKKGIKRVTRGGSWNCNIKLLRSAYRNPFPPGGQYYMLGFRLIKEM